MDSWEGSELNQAKEILAYELTKLVHGEEEAAKAQESARALFSKGVAADMPSVTPQQMTSRTAPSISCQFSLSQVLLHHVTRADVP